MHPVPGPPPIVLFALAALVQRVLAPDRARVVAPEPAADAVSEPVEVSPGPTAVDAGRRCPDRARRAAAVVAVASVGLAGSAVVRFLRAGTTIDPVRPDRSRTLVTTGPHALTRNPMYLGLAGLLAAHALALRSVAAALPVAGFLLALDRGQVAAEEIALLARFGAEYEAYRSRVPRWLGPPAPSDG